jgi:hypothetical protein
MNSLVTYSPFNCPAPGKTGIQGIRGVNYSYDVFVSGTLDTGSLQYGLIYRGPLTHNGSLGKWHQFAYTSPDFNDVVNTSCYGPNNHPDGVEWVGSYKRTSTGSSALGCLYQGPLDGSGKWTTISPNDGDTKNVYVHSIMGGLAVGNYDTKLTNGFAFIYDIASKAFDYIVAPNALTTTLYGIWHNSKENYTLAGGFTSKDLGSASQAFLADWNSRTKKMTNFRAYQGNNEKVSSLVTHFEGITEFRGGYNISAGFVSKTDADGAAFAHIRRNHDGTFGEADWQNLRYPDQAVKITTSDTVYENNVLGILVSEDGLASYLARINL